MTSTQDRAGENRSLARVSRAAGTDPGRTGASSPYPPQGELARTPSPVTRAAPGRAAARGRGGAQAPAGAPDGVLAGSTGRTITIALPSGMELLNANDRDGHWARRKRVTAALREGAGWLARTGRVPALQRAHILAVYEPPDRRRRDPANLYASFKACIDGLVDAGVLPDDDAAHLDGPDMRIGDVCRGGRLILCLTEVAAASETRDGAA